MRLTLRTLLAYLDDTLEANEARVIGEKLATNESAQELVEKIRRIRRSRSIATPITSANDFTSDPNIVAQYLNDNLSADQVTQVEESCLKSDIHLAEISACHQILTHVLSEQIRVPPTARQRMYKLTKGRESLPNQKVSNLIPIGGITEAETPATDDDQDVGYLLGLPAYSRSDAIGKRLARISVVLALLVGAMVALWIAMPSRFATQPGQPVRYASLTSPPAAAVVPPPVKATVVDPDVKPETPETDTTTQNPEVVAGPNTNTPLIPEVVLKPPAPASEERRIVGKLSALEFGVLVHRPNPQTVWQRSQGEDAELVSTERYTLLPGYKDVTLNFGSGLNVEFWANLPELDPRVQVVAASAMPLLPEATINAELSIDVGRFYFQSQIETPLKLRLRFDGAKDEIWDITLADKKTELVLEVWRVLQSGQPDAPAVISAAFAVLEGSAEVRLPGKDTLTLNKSGQIYWDSQTRQQTVTAKSEPDQWANLQGYFAKEQFYPNAEQAEAALTTLAEFNKSMTDSQRLLATLTEALLSEPTATTQPIVNARVAITMEGVLGNLTELCKLLADSEMSVHRITAIETIQYALAAGMIDIEALRTNLQTTLSIDPLTTEKIVKLLYGLSDADRIALRDKTLDRLYQQMGATELPVRELAFREVMMFMEPQDPDLKKLPYFDPAGPIDQRKGALESWGKKIEQLKVQPTPAPETETAPETPPKP